MPRWADTRRHTVVGLCVCVCVCVCVSVSLQLVFLRDSRYKLGTGECNADTMQQYLKLHSLRFLI